MRAIFTLIIFLLSITVCNGQVFEEEDDFTGQKSLHTDRFSVRAVEGSVQSSNGIFAHTYETGYIFYHHVRSSEWQHLMERTMYFLLDGERHQFEVANSDTDTDMSGNNFSIIEINAILVSEDFLKELSNSTQARFRFGSNVYEIRQDGKRLADEIINY